MFLFFGTSGLPGSGCLFPFPCYESFLPLAISSSNMISAPFFSLPSPTGTPIMQMLVTLMLFNKHLKLFTFFLFFFFNLCCSDWMSSTALSSSWLILCSVLSVLLLNPSTMFFSSVKVLFSFVALIWYLSFCFYLTSYSVNPFFSPVGWACLWITPLNFLSGKLFTLFHWGFCSFIWNMFLFVHFAGLSVLDSTQ